MWARIVWWEHEDQDDEFEYTIPLTWVDTQRKRVYWPREKNRKQETMLIENQVPPAADWFTFKLMKIKCVDGKLALVCRATRAPILKLLCNDISSSELNIRPSTEGKGRSSFLKRWSLVGGTCGRQASFIGYNTCPTKSQWVLRLSIEIIYWIFQIVERSVRDIMWQQRRSRPMTLMATTWDVGGGRGCRHTTKD